MNRFIGSAVLGTAAFLSGFLVTKAVDAQPLGIGASQTVGPPATGVLSAASGRFVFGQVSESSKDLYMLDTATGRLWRMGESGKIGIFLKGVPYLDADGECTLLPDKPSDAEPKMPAKK